MPLQYFFSNFQFLLGLSCCILYGIVLCCMYCNPMYTLCKKLLSNSIHLEQATEKGTNIKHTLICFM